MRARRPAALAVALVAVAVRLGAAERPIERISDNSFTVEEAYNQEDGVVQYIFNAVYSRGPGRRGWSFAFTQEWPLFSSRHQISYTIPAARRRAFGQREGGLEDVQLNYRYQLLEEGEGTPAAAPRFTLVVPAGSRDRGTGSGVVGYEWQLPLSKRWGERFATHANLGLSYLPGVRGRLEAGGLSPRRSLVSPRFGASGIVALSPRLHALLEWTGNSEQTLDGKGGRRREFVASLALGLRAAVIDREGFQAVVGSALLAGLTRPADDFGAFLYLSIEHRFR
jgi:hypothetical protein